MTNGFERELYPWAALGEDDPQRVDQPEPAEAPRSSELAFQQPPGSPAPLTTRRKVGAIISGLVIVLGTGGLWLASRDPSPLYQTAAATSCATNVTVYPNGTSAVFCEHAFRSEVAKEFELRGPVEVAPEHTCTDGTFSHLEDYPVIETVTLRPEDGILTGPSGVPPEVHTPGCYVWLPAD